MEAYHNTMNIAIITAGGTGQRMGSSIPKQFIEVNGKPIILYTLEVFNNHPLIDAIIVVCCKSWIKRLQNMVDKSYLDKVVKIVEGGKEGQQSIYNGLCAAKQWCEEQGNEASDTIVLIHDSVRPLGTPDLITRNIEDVQTYGNSITVIRPTETFIVEEDGKHRMLQRNDIHIVRAPQCFYLDKIMELHQQAIADGKSAYRDCCSMLCDYGILFHETEGPSTNIKITYPSDIFLFRSLIELKEMQSIWGVNTCHE